MDKLILEPVYKDYLWGGTLLKEKYNKDCDLPIVAESWELSCHPDGLSLIKNGEFAGKTLAEYLSINPAALGKNVSDGRLPVLVKLIDAGDILSVQVHPGNEYALKEENNSGKTEFWYVLDCKDGAELFFGFEKDISREEFVRRSRDGSITEELKKIPVKKGDVFLIAPGTIHAIGKDMTVFEVSTNSNITYRVYDFDRKDKKGVARELHIEKAADVFRCDLPKIQCENGVFDCGEFIETLININGEKKINVNGDSFQFITCLEGSCKVDGEISLEAGGGVFLAAGYGDCAIIGEAVLIITSV